MDPNSKIGQVLEQGKTTAANSLSRGAGDVASSLRDQIVPSDKPDQDAQEFVSELYEPTTEPQTDTEQRAKEIEAQDTLKIKKIREELHANYFQSLSVKPKQEERAQDRVERLDSESLSSLQDQKESELPIAVAQKAQRVEKFPGTGG